MLPPQHRLRDGALYTRAVRNGVRVGGDGLVVHLWTEREFVGTCPAVVGLIVSKAIGNAVTRNLVKRRMRAIAASHVTDLPEGTVLVVRATPASANMSITRLSADMSICLSRAVRKLEQ